MSKPSFTRRLLAHDLVVSAVAGSLLVAVITAILCGPHVGSFESATFCLLFSFAVAIAFLLGAALGMLALRPVVVVVGGRMNGYPFKPGDDVHVLVGHHRGHVCRVDDVWSDRRQIRLDLGDQARADMSDVFAPNEIWRSPERARSLRAPTT